MKTLLLFLAFLFTLSATPENPLIPETWFHEIIATDGSTQQCIIFTTIPGVEYTFYHSNELEQWTEIGKTYGLGQQFSAAMRETAPAPPPPDPENPPPPGPVFLPASITIKPSSGTAGGTVVSWPSLDHGNAVQYLITGTMATAWSSVPLFSENYGTHHFFISHTPGDTSPPETNPFLDPEDSAMIADLEAAWSTFNTSVTTAQQTAINTPPPPPPAPDAKGFWRIKADWSLDSDNDDIFDYIEFAFAAANPPGPNGLAGNAFNADTNGDGRPDGKEVDTDGDGIPNSEDINQNDGLVAYRKVRLPRYAMFTFPEGGVSVDGYSFAINDLGTVLFRDRYWKAGELQYLIDTDTSLPARIGDPFPNPFLTRFRALAINDEDRIIGSGNRELWTDGFFIRSFSQVCYWDAPSGTPEVIEKTDGTVTTYAETSGDFSGTYVDHLDNPENPDNPNGPDNLGKFFSNSFTWDTAIEGFDKDEDDGWKKWTFPASGGTPVGAPGTEFAKGSSERGLIWTSEYDPFYGDGTGGWTDSNITAPFSSELPFEPLNLLWQVDTNLLVATAARYDTSTRVLKNGEWLVSGMLRKAVDIAADGTAIGRNYIDAEIPAEILLNGQWTGLGRAVPGIPQDWIDNPAIALVDTSPGGWILAKNHHNDPLVADTAAALLPLRFKGQYTDSDDNLHEGAVGVDDFSIGSYSPDLHPENLMPVRERIWIMAPKGVDKTVTLHAPLSAGSSLKLSATGVSFNSQSHVTCSSPATTFTIRADNGFLDGETDMFIDISDGTFDTPAVNTPIGVKRMKARTVNVTVYKVGDLSSPGGAVISADRVPDEAVLQAYLNRVYKPQVNVDIIVTVMPLQAETSVDSDANGRFDWDDGEHSADQDSIATAALAQSGAASNPANITVYLLGTNKPLGGGAKGMTTPPERTCWVKCRGNQSHREEEETADAIRTIAHEIGHVMIGEGHPGAKVGNSEGIAPLHRTRHSERLMRDGNNNPDSDACLLVKAEWDEIENWLKAEENAGRLPN